MVASIQNEVQIEDLGNHPAEMVLTLRNLLTGGAKVTPDPKRNNFYEVEHGALVYYIHVSPVTSNILLLATWANEGVPAGAGEAA